MLYTPIIKEAIALAIETHELNQKQKRKGKDVPYISHVLTVGLILSLYKAKEEVIIAGILHDTIEDSIPERKITKESIVEKFGEEVAKLVDSVTEQDKSLPWKVRKQEAINHIEFMDKDSMLLKSADILSNISETADDYEKMGDRVFLRYNSGKEAVKNNYKILFEMLKKHWVENPILPEILMNMKRLD